MASKAGGKKPMANKSIAAPQVASKAAGKKPLTNKSISTEQVVPLAEKKLPMGESRKKGRKQKKLRETFNCYIYRVLKQVHPDVGISRKAIGIMDCFVNDIFDKLAGEAIKLSIHSKKTTISAREIQTSAKLMLPGELAKHAISEGVKAVTRFSTD
ncbi:hypothetical protein SUGI_0880660 [Cryptomeria japonica]|uniref:uncharacterized protein LOC131071276 n=1 Tax=Cryptomeria japonica TaxID=3369 RepID=UPI0024147869|nr:uncharacterized protein LOC131071276 [Cryptomeria japonica]GLJ42490.1 hypothetical protein SUGI_0880660 [Cryptomeria japonica]